MCYTKEYFEMRSRHPMWRVEADVLRDAIGDAGRGLVVDVGCGSGELLTLIHPVRGIGVDCDETALATARSRSSEYEFRFADAGDLGLEKGSVDGIVSMHLVEHLPDLEATLRHWYSRLKPGGRLALVTPNGRFRHPEVFWDPDHRHIYDGPELAFRVAQVGFAVERAFTVGAWGLRTCPFFWRYAEFFYRMKLPPVPGLRWRGQSLCLVAVKGTRSERNEEGS